MTAPADNACGGRLLAAALLFLVGACQPSSPPSKEPGTAAPAPSGTHAPAPGGPRPNFHLADIPDFDLTNQLGKRVRLQDFRGQAVALTFFFTRCPLPEYCPRLSRSFAEAGRRLAAAQGGRTNWQLISISFDPFDTPEVLRNYAERYQYDSNHWSFLTGDAAQIRELTRGFGLSATPESGVFNHDFRTVVFDASGRLQTIWPFGGDTSAMLVAELSKGAAVKP